MCHLKPRPHRSLEECQQLLKERLPGIEKWAAYGLCIHDSVYAIGDPESATRNHNLVADYLDAHPELVEKYKADQSGEVKYYDVLRLAEGVKP